MILELDFTQLLVVFNRRYSLSEFRAAAHVVSGTYADELIERMHNCLFVCPKDIRIEFEKYYRIEYPDFIDFLYWKYGLRKDVAQRIAGRVKDNIYIGYGTDSVGIFTAEAGASALKDILSELGEVDDENTE